ncbi:hypothetical protein JB92DRAFT_1051973 [Gautieria morchelliformis]|nr:hypothetical protein JB92DRAFT_1051973 [Gautieria morchelliformis]
MRKLLLAPHLDNGMLPLRPPHDRTSDAREALPSRVDATIDASSDISGGRRTQAACRFEQQTIDLPASSHLPLHQWLQGRRSRYEYFQARPPNLPWCHTVLARSRTQRNTRSFAGTVNLVMSLLATRKRPLEYLATIFLLVGCLRRKTTLVHVMVEAMFMSPDLPTNVTIQEIQDFLSESYRKLVISCSRGRVYHNDDFTIPGAEVVEGSG